MAELDNGSRVELKSAVETDFTDLMTRYNDLSKIKEADTRQAELDAYARGRWADLAKQAAVITPWTTEKTIAEWVEKVKDAHLPPPSDIVEDRI